MAKKRIVKAKIDFISLCPRGKNYMPVLYKEDDGTVAAQAETILVKGTEEQVEKGEVLALVYVPEKIDADGDLASAEVIKEMAYSHAKSGSKLDIRHDNSPIAKEAAYVAESFLVQKGDPRFSGVQDSHGNQVDATGGWGVVIKLEDDTLKKLYKEGAWNGVSMGGSGLRQPEVKKENRNMDEKQMSDLTKAIVDGIVTGLAPILKAKEPETPKDDKPKSLAFTGDPTDLKAVRAFRKAKEREMLQKAVNWDDPEAVKAYEDALEKAQEEERQERASGQVVKGSDGSQGDDFPQGTPKILKEGTTLGSRLAAYVNGQGRPKA